MKDYLGAREAAILSASDLPESALRDAPNPSEVFLEAKLVDALEAVRRLRDAGYRVTWHGAGMIVVSL